jgi:TRAP-type mannitol/chloroaromatic compound transport system permease small subunit
MVSRIICVIDAVNGRLYQLAGLLTLALTALVFGIVLLRYAANSGSTALQEAALYLHALIFMLAVAHAIPRGEHVRVDVLSARLSERAKRHIELFGTLVFLLPFAAFLLVMSWDYVGRAWAIRESSPDPGGLPILYLLKTTILVMAGQLLLQGIAEVLRLTQRSAYS